MVQKGCLLSWVFGQFLLGFAPFSEAQEIEIVARDTTYGFHYADPSRGGISGVRFDPTDPARTIGLTVRLSGFTADVELAVESKDPQIATAALRGSGEERQLLVTPRGVGKTTISVRVGSVVQEFPYWASDAVGAPSRTRYHTGSSDASTAIRWGRFMFVANDEPVDGSSADVRLYDRLRSGLPIREFDFSAELDICPGEPEVDIEGSARVGRRIYWIASMSNSKSGKCRRSRHRIFRTDIVGSGAAASLRFIGSYDGLRKDLREWDAANGDRLGLAASAACEADNDCSPACPDAGGCPGTGIEPKRVDGFNIEAFEIDSGGAALAFRAPLQPVSGPNARTRALVVGIVDFESWFAQAMVNPTPPQLNLVNDEFWDFGSRGFRSLEVDGTGRYLILAGSPGAVSDFALYSWTPDTPLGHRHTCDFASLELGTGSPEGILSEPAFPFTHVELLIDDGTTDWYATGEASKNLPGYRQKFRTVVLECKPEGDDFIFYATDPVRCDDVDSQLFIPCAPGSLWFSNTYGCGCIDRGPLVALPPGF